MRCTARAGYYSRWSLTEAGEDTFCEVEVGMEPDATRLQGCWTRRRQALVPQHGRVDARAACARRSREAAAATARPLAGARRARGGRVPADLARRSRGRGHVPRLRHLARARYRGAAGAARARVHPGPDRRLQVEGRDQGRAGCRVRRRRARAAGRRRLRPGGLPGPARDPARRRRRDRGRRAPLARASGDRRGGPGREHSASRSGSTTTWRGTTCDPARRRQRRHDGLRRVRRRHAVVHLALRAAARARLPVGDLGLEFAEIEAGKSRWKVLLPAIIFCLSFTRDVRRARDDARPASARRWARTATPLRQISGIVLDR